MQIFEQKSTTKKWHISILYKIQYFKDHLCGEAANPHLIAS